MKDALYHAKMESGTSMDAMKTRTPTATPNGNQGGARALPVEVKIALAFDAALSAGGCAVSASWGCALPALGLALACAVSVATFAALKGGAE